MTGFDEFIALDWSGAAGRYEGISVARCMPGRDAPQRVPPSAIGVGVPRWTRTAVAAWLESELRSGRRLLIGFDFAFGMPFEPGLGYLAGDASEASDIFALWDLIEHAGAGDADFGCLSVIADSRFAPLYWRSGTQAKTWILRQRRSEIACVAASGTRPECVFKLIGSKQVGKASLSGIRVLRHVRARNPGRVAVWPFEPVGTKSTLVEIYPTLFRKLAAGRLAKLRSRETLNAALRQLGSRGVREADLSDHDTDALISAAGLRHAMAQPGVLPAAADERIRREGWIFGVPMPMAQAEAA